MEPPMRKQPLDAPVLYVGEGHLSFVVNVARMAPFSQGLRRWVISPVLLHREEHS